jgi:hypothetical protein
MNTVRQRMEAHPESTATDLGRLSDCIQALTDCAQSCTLCADACLAEDKLAQLRACIRLNQNCADVCWMAASLATRQGHPDWQLLRGAVELATKACDACAAECELRASHHRHCQLCADACRTTQAACDALLAELRS